MCRRAWYRESTTPRNALAFFIGAAQSTPTPNIKVHFNGFHTNLRYQTTLLLPCHFWGKIVQYSIEHSLLCSSIQNTSPSHWRGDAAKCFYLAGHLRNTSCWELCSFMEFYLFLQEQLQLYCAYARQLLIEVRGLK